MQLAQVAYYLRISYKQHPIWIRNFKSFFQVMLQFYARLSQDFVLGFCYSCYSVNVEFVSYEDTF